ncbi:sigma-70 family RNA polymerase sigma factor [Ahrensia sp. R2A130]|uniref:sigma-70 family RNA polymerase sigma factor n=1 Tax=Ahrensia sp. R2A130 TaxID=744979 RepID=UPI0001E0ACF8|nr:sigma-70 family RNA polymerase sigma factor [Ahrensia sp. R2A130]EFL87755.1 RNA polymerase sigma factor [Ahrensia sp. R2A130]
MSVPDTFKTELLSVIPNLRAFALSLTKTADKADDLVQETLMKAWNKHHLFQAGTNLKAWTFTIMRNEFYSQMRKRGREVQDSEGVLASQLASHPEQQGHMDMQDFKAALEDLPEDQREALVLIGANGFSYEEAAEIVGVAVGTIKSRVSRARSRLVEDLGLDEEGEFGPDAISSHIVGSVALDSRR